MHSPGPARLFAPALLICAAAVSACGGSSAPTTSHGQSTSPAPRTTTSALSAASPPGLRHAHRDPRRHTAATAEPRIGAAQHVRVAGTTLVVTIDQVIDPLRVHSAAIPPGSKAVGVEVSVRDAGPGSYDSSATGDFSLETAAGEASPVFVPSGQCQTPLQDFMNDIGAGGARMGCVAFAIPKGQSPTDVRFSPDGGTAGVSRSWEVS